MSIRRKYSFPWRGRFGQYPHVSGSWPLYSFKERDGFAGGQELTEDFKINPKHYNGHTCQRMNTYHTGCRLISDACLSPLFVKDISGRYIYIGYGPEFKEEEEWKSSTILFPRFCEAVSGDDYGLDSHIFTSFRTLDMSLEMKARPSGEPDDEYPLTYINPNLLPYKLRLDTFYADGWKVPQTEYLYVKTDGLTLTETESAAADFFAKWDSRENLSYEEWYDKYDGDNWFETLFDKGVTVIPTFEAYNGYNKVTTDFDLEDFWPGRAVSGLHQVIGMEASDAPKGTILQVKRPGLAMGRRIEPAQVIVSDGSHYKSSHAEDPEPYLPDLRLPHTRSVTEWGACHLPTHPSHFEEPALWGWDKQTGKFMQLSGPLWDPLHYYYKSVDNVVRALKDPSEDGSAVVSVPEHMKLKFYPIDVMHGYDVLDTNVYYARQENGIAINSAVRRKPLEEQSCTLGYHPLPLEIEYELDNWWFPELAPKNRLEQSSPSPLISKRLLPVIRSNVSPSYYAKEVEGQPWWISDIDNLKIATGRPLEDYPYLARYLGNETDLGKIAEWVNLHLEHISDETMESSAHQLWPDDRAEVLDKISPGFYTALMDMRSKGVDLMRLRHSLYRGNPSLYYAAFWAMISIDELIQQVKAIESEAREDEYHAQQQSNENYLLDKSNLKSSELGGSLDEDGSF